MAPSAADRTQLPRCAGTRPYIRPVDGVELEDSLGTRLERFISDVSAVETVEQIIEVIPESMRDVINNSVIVVSIKDQWILLSV